MKIIKWFAAITGTLIVVVVLTLAFIDWNIFRGYISNVVSESIGRRFEIAGDLDVDLSLTPRIQVNDVRLANAQWGQQPLMAQVASVETKIKLIPLILGRVEIVHLQINNPQVLLEKSKEGVGNWDFAPANKQQNDKKSASGLPRIDDLVLANGEVRYHDWGKALDFTATTINVNGKLPASNTTVLQGSWQVYDLPFSMAIQADPINDFNKVIEQVNKAQAINVKNTNDNQWGLKQLKLQIGESTIDVAMALMVREARPHIAATVKSNRLLLSDLRKINKLMIEGPPEKEVLPENTFNTAFLQDFDSTVNFDLSSIVTPVMTSSFAGRASLDKGYLQMEISKFAVAEGNIEGMVALDTRPIVPKAAIDLRLKGIQTHVLLKKSEITDGTSGKLYGHIDVKGEGQSVANMASTADGEVAFVMNGGTLDNLIVEALGVDIAELIGVISYDTRKQEIPTRLRCAVGIMPIHDGTMQAKTLIFDSKDSTIVGEGSINFGKEKLDLKVTAHPKDFSALSARTPILVSGTFRDPRVRPGPALAGKGLAALALGTLVTPLAALIPFIEPGLAEDKNCNELFQKTAQFDKKNSKS